MSLLIKYTSIFFLFFTCCYAKTLPIPSFQAHYHLYAKKIKIGTGSITLTEPTPWHYHLTMKATPQGVTTLFFSGSFSEIVSGSLKNNIIQPFHYKRQHQNNKLATFSQFDFDWNKQLVSFKVQDKTGQVKNGKLPLKPNLVDPLSLHLLIMMDLSQQIYRSQYSFLDNGEIKTYAIEHIGLETIKIGQQSIKAYKIQQQRVGTTRQTLIWLNPKQHYLPLKILQLKDRKEALRMELDYVSNESSK